MGMSKRRPRRSNRELKKKVIKEIHDYLYFKCGETCACQHIKNHYHKLFRKGEM